MKSGGTLQPWTIRRRAVGLHDIGVEVRWVGICHTDIHCVGAEWGEEVYPMVPGHEITGVVTVVGDAVTKFQVGDRVGVGDFVDSCRLCSKCKEGRQQFCRGGGKLLTYGMEYIYEHCAERGARAIPVTYGGYSEYLVVDERYAFRIPANLDLAGAAPLLCAGATAYNALVRHGGRDGCRVGVAGLGGIGHIAAKLAHAMGCHVTILSRSADKKAAATESALGAHAFIDTSDAAQVEAAEESLDLIIDTISATHDVDQLLSLVRNDGGNVCVVGLPPAGLQLNAHSLVGPGKRLTSADAGGTVELQAMLDFCGEHALTCDVECIGASEVNAAFARTLAGEVHYRFVIDASTI